MKALAIISGRSAIGSLEVNQHRTDLLRQQLRSRGIEVTERTNSFATYFAISVELFGNDFYEIIRLARRYGQENVVMWREDGRMFRYHLAPGAGGAPIESIEELLWP